MSLRAALTDKLRDTLDGVLGPLTVTKQVRLGTRLNELASLGSALAGKGASLIAIRDAGGLLLATTVEGALQEIAAALVTMATEISGYRNTLVRADVQVTGGGGGAAAGTLEVTVTRAGSGNPLTNARDVLIVATPEQYDPALVIKTTVTFAGATVGSILASGNGWALVRTNAAGKMECVPSNSADETIYFRALTAQGNPDTTKRCAVVSTNSDPATWSA